MKAVTVVESGVQIIDVDTPSPKDSEVLVKVHACGLNRADMVVADGGAHGAAGGPGTIVGMEFSGEIIKCGEHVKNLSIGDRVMCSGASVWAEYAIADYGRVIKIPACKNNNIKVGIHCLSPSYLKEKLSNGYDLATLASDVRIYAEGLSNKIKEARS